MVDVVPKEKIHEQKLGLIGKGTKHLRLVTVLQSKH